MKKVIISLFAVCAFLLSAHAQQQVFTIDGYVDENITDSCYNIYLADEYFWFDENSKPVATVPVVNKRFTYSIPLEKTTAGRVRRIFPGGELCSAWIDLFFVPGETVKLTVHNGYFHMDRPYNYKMKVNRAVEAFRKETNWQSPHLPKVKGEVWKDVAYDKNEGYPRLYVKDVIFNEEETVLRIVYNEHHYDMNISKDSYLEDEAGNEYKLKRALMGEVDGNNSQDVRVFGGYYAFEPMAKGTTSFSFHNVLERKTNNTKYTTEQIVNDIHKAEKRKARKPNFDMDVHVSQGIGDSGYLVFLYDELDGVIRNQIDDIAVKDRKCSFSTYIDKPYLADLFATFPDGSVCTHCVRLPFVPGEHVDVKVINGGFYLNGTKFYHEWADADDLIENAHKYHKAEETDSILKTYLREHGNEEGCAICFIQEHALPSKTLRELIPEAFFNGRMKNIVDFLMRQLEIEER